MPDPTFDPHGSAARHQFERYHAEACRIPDGEVLPMRADWNLAIANARTGIDALRPHEAAIRRALPEVRWEAIAGFDDLALALAHAAIEVERFAPPPSDLRDRLARAYELRKKLLCCADVVALLGDVPAAEVAAIRKGRGSIDAAGDCVALAALFTRRPVARAKVPVSVEELGEAEALGAGLLLDLRPKSAGSKGTDAGLAAATLARDRLWTLFTRTWEDEVWRSGAWIWRREVDDHVPALASRRVARPPEPPGP
jgi:hypothetical protein